jgi:hypothetical protein
MLEAAAAAAVQMMDVDDNAGVESSLGSTSISCGAGQALQLAAEHMAVDKENASGAPVDRDPEAADPKVDSATRMPRSTACAQPLT